MVDLTSLEPMLHDYCDKAWGVHQKRQHYADPNAPREPGYFGVHVHRAARIVDVTLGANPDVLDAAFAESGGELSVRTRALVDEYPKVARMFDKGGIEAVYLGAGLTRGEADCVRYQHQGITHSGIADLTGRKEGTVKALLARSHWKLQGLVAQGGEDETWPWAENAKERQDVASTQLAHLTWIEAATQSQDTQRAHDSTSFNWNTNLGELPTHPSTSNVRHRKVAQMGPDVADQYGRCQVRDCEFEAAGCTKLEGAHIVGAASGGDTDPHRFLALCAVHHTTFDTGIGLDLASLWIKPGHHPERYVGGQLRATVA